MTPPNPRPRVPLARQRVPLSSSDTSKPAHIDAAIRAYKRELDKEYAAKDKAREAEVEQRVREAVAAATVDTTGKTPAEAAIRRLNAEATAAPFTKTQVVKLNAFAKRMVKAYSALYDEWVKTAENQKREEIAAYIKQHLPDLEKREAEAHRLEEYWRARLNDGKPHLTADEVNAINGCSRGQFSFTGNPQAGVNRL